MKPIGVLRFPGTNCDLDTFRALDELGLRPQWLWYEERFEPADFDGFIVPGGFSFGDYLRSGVLASHCPAMESLKKAAADGKAILGICNGFQILCEAKLLPGALLKNQSMRFIDRWVEVEEVMDLKAAKVRVLRMPVAHGEGRYYCPQKDVSEMHRRGQIWLTYRDNPNGSVENIAGVCNETKNVRGLMPHPERAMHAWMGSEDGKALLQGVFLQKAAGESL